MISRLKEFFNRGKNVSVVKKFIDNPDTFILKMEVINNEIIISIKEKEKIKDEE